MVPNETRSARQTDPAKTDPAKTDSGQHGTALNAPSRDSAFAPGVQRIAVLGSPQFTPTVAGELRKILAGAEIVALGDFGLITGDAIALGAGADAIVVVAAADEGLSVAARQALLLAWGLGARPILVTIEKGPQKPGATAATGNALALWARGLGARSIDWATLPAGVDQLAELLRERLVAGAGASPLRAWVERVGAADGADDGEVQFEARLVAGQMTNGRPVIAMPAAQPVVVGSCEMTTGDGANQERRVRFTLVGGPEFRAAEVRVGDLIADAGAPPEQADQVAAHVVWVDQRPLLPGRSYLLRLGPQSVPMQVSTLKHRLNPIDLDTMAARQLGRGDVGLCNLSFAEPILFDPFERCQSLGRFEIVDPKDGRIAGFGRIAFTLRRATNIHWQAMLVDKAARAALKGQRPCCLWLTGLSGSGKSTIASLLEKRLNAAGRHTYMLDGDNVRHGLNRDLGFTDADRVENIRRVSEVARLFVDAGLITLVSFISPFRAERRMARDLFPEVEFLEIFVDTPIAICESRDPKGLYKKARAGALKNFTGIDSPYETPERADIHLEGGVAPADALVDQIYRELQRRGIV